jgi:hypothetical protein
VSRFFRQVRHEEPEAHIDHSGKFQRAVSDQAFFDFFAHALVTDFPRSRFPVYLRLQLLFLLIHFLANFPEAISQSLHFFLKLVDALLRSFRLAMCSKLSNTKRRARPHKCAP